MQQLSTFVKLSPKEVVTDEWEVLDDPGDFKIDDLVLILLGLIFCILPGLLAVLLVLTRPKRRGYLCLTNWRCLYYERGEGVFKNYHRVATADLNDIVAVHSVYEEGILGKRTMFLTLNTKYEDSIAIQIGDVGGPLSKLPLIGKLFRRTSIGRDAVHVPPVLFNLIQERQMAAADTSSAF